MKIFTQSQIKEADKYTMQEESISSLELMERVSHSLAEQIHTLITKETPLLFFIGKGNNGGDGLAIARILSHLGYNCSISLMWAEEFMTDECRINFQRLPNAVRKVDSSFIPSANYVIIDAILGTGVRGRVTEKVATQIEKINSSGNKVISIDLPSGMATEWQTEEKPILVKADITLTIEYPKLGMLLPDVGEYCGKIIIVPIKLS